MEISIEKSAINPEALDAELKAAFGDVYSGLAYGKYGPENSGSAIVRVVLAEPTGQQIDLVQLIVESHDATLLTLEQAIRQEHSEMLKQLRQQSAAPISISDYESESPAIQSLARKVALLELELQELRGG